MKKHIDKVEPRRARRKADWLKNNIPPLSTKDATKVRNKINRDKKKIKFEAPIRFDLSYINEMNNFVSSQQYNVKGSFTYRKNVSTYKCFKDATYILEALCMNGKIKNYFFVVDYEPQHAHTHFIINAVNPDTIRTFLHKTFNRYEQGKSWCKVIGDKEELNEAIKYLTDKLDGKLAIRQLSIDYWGIRTEKELTPNLPAVETV